jgi:hypothetical protein
MRFPGVLPLWFEVNDKSSFYVKSTNNKLLLIVGCIHNGPAHFWGQLVTAVDTRLSIVASDAWESNVGLCRGTFQMH